MAKRKRSVAASNGATPCECGHPENRFDLVLGLRKLRAGPFSGLWELTSLIVDPEHTVVKAVLSDANLKRFVMARASREFGKMI